MGVTMAEKRINDRFLREFFGIDDTPEGREELEEIKKKLVRIQFENGKDICTIDGEPDGMFFLESGTAVVLGREGEQLNIMHEGQYFGEYAVLAKQKRLSTVRSLGRTIVYRLNADDMMKILMQHPDVYGEFMKRVYGQVSGKHSQILALSGMRKGILQHPRNQTPLSKKQMAIQYGALALLYLLAFLIIPAGSELPVFLLPLILMLVYVIITKRTLESLIVSGILAALLLYRQGLSASYVDALMATMESPDNVFTVLVMALMGGVVQLIEASGAVTAFKMLADKIVRGKKSAMLASYGIMAVTCIDDGLNMSCAASSTNPVAKEQAIPRERMSLLYSLLPTVLSSFLPLSLWGIFVIGTISASIKEGTVELFCTSIPLNFFSVLTVIVMLLYCCGRFPLSKALKAADKRVQEGGNLWPEGSEKYLSLHEPEMWGKIYNIMLPILVLAVSSLAIRSVIAGSFVLDSACGLVATLLFMFLLYCAQGLMSPEQFMEHLVTGMANTTLPIVMYLLTMCFSSLLEGLQLNEYFLILVDRFQGMGYLFPAVIFLASMFLTVALGSSWAMYAIAFPIAIHLAPGLGVNLALCIGAISGAGIAGEKNCLFTADALNVGTAIGCNPDKVLRVRMKYSIAITSVAALMYLIAGVVMR